MKSPQESLTFIAQGLREAARSTPDGAPMAGARRCQLLKAAGLVEMARGELAMLASFPVVDRVYDVALGLMDEREKENDT